MFIACAIANGKPSAPPEKISAASVSVMPSPSASTPSIAAMTTRPRVSTAKTVRGAISSAAGRSMRTAARARATPAALGAPSSTMTPKPLVAETTPRVATSARVSGPITVAFAVTAKSGEPSPAHSTTLPPTTTSPRQYVGFGANWKKPPLAATAQPWRRAVAVVVCSVAQPAAGSSTEKRGTSSRVAAYQLKRVPVLFTVA